MKLKTPTSCPKSYNPYTFCPLKFVYEDDMILYYINSLQNDVIRLHDQKRDDEIAMRTDRCCSEITAYMNGRIHELIKK